ncbi:MBL fold metallo-hydrolase [Plantibacter flavus]|uniref:MBL fold metallo-hydrolase n=1 Tax=Plantibacter flavus TaxID=150123 RepID=UPI003F166589
MRLTKFEHAAFLLEQDGTKLIVDPGSFTSPIADVSNTTAVVITHLHPDHWTPEHLDRILAASPDAVVYGPAGVAAAADGYEITIVAPGDTIENGPFTLRFFGGTHAVIHSSIPVIDNVGVLVNEQVYYPGDSFTVPDGVEVDVLAAPAGAPWMKIAEGIDFVLAVAPKRAFGTHEMVLSAAGQAMSHGRLQWATEQGGGTYSPLAPFDTLEV